MYQKESMIMHDHLRRIVFFCLITLGVSVFGCAHYPVNRQLTQFDPDYGYRGKNQRNEKQSDEIVLILAFSGGGTRAAAFSYGTLEALRDTEVTINGKKTRLLDEVDAISGVSGGSFTAAYYGLFGERIFEDFESKFLKKNVQGALMAQTLLNPYNWVRLGSSTFDRSDLAAEYYDRNIFEGKTFGDMAASNGPLIVVNATDMILGNRISFYQNSFDVICSDISQFPVSRAVAASSAVPGLLSAITLKNYAGSCGFAIPDHIQEVLNERETSNRQYIYVNNSLPYLNAEKMRHIHLVDGGVADNLGLRTAIERILVHENFWESVKDSKVKKARKVVFLLVNAETEVSRKFNLFDKPPPFAAMLGSYTSIAITRYNFETVMLLRENFRRWKQEMQEGRCGGGKVLTEPGECGDISFHLIEVKFDALKDEDRRSYFKQLPTSFKLDDEVVEELRDVARELLAESPEFREFLDELQGE
jgi:NTE family protein